MKIAICASIQFTPEIKATAEKLESGGHIVIIPDGAERIIRGEITLEEFLQKADTGKGAEAKIKHNVIKKYFDKMKTVDAILVLNITKKNIENYIGGNTFLEIGFAHVLGKKIFLFNPIPEVSYKDEIVAMQPYVINQDLIC